MKILGYVKQELEKKAVETIGVAWKNGFKMI